MIDIHLSEIDYLLLPSDGVDLHDRQRSTGAERTIKNINSEDDRVTFTERSDDLQSARPHRLRSGVSSLRLDNLSIVCCELVEQMVDDVG